MTPGLQPLPDVLAASGIEAELQAAQKRQALAVMRQLGALRQALDCFREQGVPCLVLKGLPLSERLYGTPFARRSVDVDLLVDRGSFAACRQMLLASGFGHVPDYRETPVRRRWDAMAGKTQTFTLGGGATRVAVELHWRLLANPHYIDTAFNSLYQRRSSTRIGSTPMPTLGEPTSSCI